MTRARRFAARRRADVPIARPSSARRIPHPRFALILAAALFQVSTSEVAAQSTDPRGLPPELQTTEPWQGPGLRTTIPPIEENGARGGDPGAPIRVLPPLSTLSGPAEDADEPRTQGATQPRVIFLLNAVEFSGNTVFSDSELQRLVSAYLTRPISTAELLQIRNDVTAYYVSKGYVSSGARIPDQVPTDGRLRLEIIEGRLDEIEFVNSTRLSPSYVVRRLRLDADRPLQVEQLERRLRNLQESSPIRRFDVRVEPGLHPGRDRLVLAIEEAPDAFAWGEAGTLVSPNLGGWAARAGVDLNSPIGWGEQARTRLTVAEGIVDLENEVSVPLWAYDTRLSLRTRYAETRVVSDSLRTARIETQFASVGFEVLHPVWRSEGGQLNLGVLGEWRQGITRLDGTKVAFSEGSRGGELRVAALRLFASGRIQSSRQVIGFRSTWSIGLDALGATTQSRGLEDARFHAWLGQVQWLRSFADRSVDILVRGDVQVANDRLLPIERFSIGGRYSVRGYRENVFVRDNGAAGSIEIRWQAIREIDRRRVLEPFVFFDAGHSWEAGDRSGDRSDSLAALGIGLRYSPRRWIDLEFSYARRLKDRPSVVEEDVQDEGLSLRVQVATF